MSISKIDWQVATIADFQTAPANVTIAANVTLTIAPSGILEVDFANHSLTVTDSGGVLVKQGGSLAQTGRLSPPPSGGSAENLLVFHHADHLTGASVDTDQNGTLLQLTDYYPFGDERIEDTTSSFHNDYTYTGKERDEDTKLLYYEARYYDSTLGRFLSLDPWKGDITDPQSFNKYAYVRNNPLKYVDPEGEVYVSPQNQNMFQDAFDIYKRALELIGVGAYEAADESAFGLLPDQEINTPLEEEYARYGVTAAMLADVGTGAKSFLTKKSLKVFAKSADSIWAASRQQAASVRAWVHWRKHGKAFGANSPHEYLQQAKTFINNVPNTAETIVRENGDTLIYDRSTNIFAIKNADGKVETFFKPKNGDKYWKNKQAEETKRKKKKKGGGSG